MPARTRMNGVPTRPLGHPDVLWGLPGQGGLLTEWAETVPDLTWPESIRTYGRMRRDSKIAAVLSAFFLPIMRTNWMVDPAGVKQAKLVDLVAGDLGLPILGEKGPPPVPAVPGFHWTEHLRLALLSNVYGFFPFERWYNPRAKDGLTHLAGLDERMPHTISMIDLDDNGQVRSVFQNTQDDPLPASRMLWYAHEREGANWAGVSMLRAAYTPWVLKHETMRVHATSIRRWGMGIPVVKAPPGGTPGQVEEARRLASGMRAGDTAGAGLPDGYTLQITGISGSVPDALGFLNYCDQQIASASLAVFLELGLSSGGARALGDTFVDMFLLALQAAADAIGDTCSYGAPAMPGISRALADLNFGPDEPCPRIVAVDVGDRHEVTATAIQQLVMCGAVQPDDALEAFIREAWDFPARTTPRTPPPPPKGAPGTPGAPPGPGAPGGGSPNPAAPANPNPGAPAPPSRQPGVPRPMTGPPGRRGGQPATGPSRPAGGPTATAEASAPAGPRRPLTAAEAAAGLDPEAMRAELETATDRVLAAWAPVLKAQRAELADQVAAAVDDGHLDQLAQLQAPAGDAAGVLYRAMAAVAAQAAGRAVAEAAGQGVTINLAGVQLNHGRLRQLAQARATMAAQALAQAAAHKALQVVTASAGTEAAREVTAVLHGLSPRSLADQLMAALHAAANEARFAVLAAGPEAVYTATELADDPSCCGPCKDIDGHQFAGLDDARNAYANGAYIGCSGGLRCRGTVVATWPHTPFRLQVPGTGEPGIAAAYNPDEARGPGGEWIHITDSPLGPAGRLHRHQVDGLTLDGRQVTGEYDHGRAQVTDAQGIRHPVRAIRDLAPPRTGGNWPEGWLHDRGLASAGNTPAAAFHPDEPRDPHTGKWTSGGGSARSAAHDLAKVAAFPGGRGEAVTPITAAEARGNSRPVTLAEYQRLAAEGRDHMARLRANPQPPAGLDRHWDTIVTSSYAETRKSWGGATIDAHTGQALPQGADKFALTVKPAGLDSVSVPETASETDFRAAMDKARTLFDGELTAKQAYLGIFHDDDLHRVDIDPVLVVGSLHEVETIGAFTHAIGGAYRFSDGNGYWPPHVADVPAQVAAAKDDEQGKPVPFKGPGQWRTQADQPRRDALKRIHEDDDGTAEPAGPDTAASAVSVRIDVTLAPGRELPGWHQPAHPGLDSAQEEIRRLRDWAAADGGTPIREVVLSEAGEPGPKGDAARAAAGTPGTTWTVRYVFADPTRPRVPADQEDEYLYPPHGPIAARALRKPLPPEMIYGHQLEPYNDDGSNPQRAAAEAASGGWDEDRHPRGRGGEWVRLDRAGMDRMLASEFRPQRLEAEQVRHPRSGWMVDAGVERRVSRPDGPAPAGDSLGPEGPATFDLIDHGNPLDPAYNSLAYMAGKRAGTEPIAHVYRGMSADEWDQAQRRGFIQSDKRGDISPREGTNAAADPRDAVSYLPHGPGVLAKIKVRPEDKWFTIGADQYLRTRQRIPLDRVEHTIEIRRGGEYDAEFEARPAQLAHAAFDEAKHPRGWHGRFGHGTGHEALDGGDRRLIADQLTQWAKTEKDANLKTALGMVSDSYQAGDNHDAAYRLRLAADRARQLGRPGDAGEMTAIAGLIEKIKPPAGGEGYPSQYRDRLSSYWRGETDGEARQALNQAAAAYNDNQYDQPADLLRTAAGRVGPLGRTQDADKYNALADAIEKQGQDNGISHTTQALNAIGTETDATSYGDVADQLSNARRAIERAEPGTNWRVQAASYLRVAASRAISHDDGAAARRYENLSSRVLHLPDAQAPGNTALAALVGRAVPAVPRLLGGGDPRWNGKAGTFTPAQQPDYLGFAYPDGHIELRTDVVNGLLDTQAHPGQVMAEPDNLDVVLHELIHDTTGGRTEQDKKDWAALSRDDKNALGAISELDQRGDPSGRGNPVARTASEIQRAHLWITPPQLDSFLASGLMEKTGTSSGHWDETTGETRMEPDIRLTAKARRMLGTDTAADDSNEYTSVTGHDAEEGFTELGATQHMEQFAAATGFGDVPTTRLSTAPITGVPTVSQLYDVQHEVTDLYTAAGKVGNPGTINGPGSLEAYTALADAQQEIWAPHTRPAKVAEYLMQAYRAEPDPGVRARIGNLANRLGIKGGGPVDNPAWNKTQAGLLAGMRAVQATLQKDGRPSQDQAARHLTDAITAVDSGFTASDDIGAVLSEVQHLGDIAMADQAISLRAKLDQLNATPAYKHDTVPEYARWLADPAKLAGGGSWGHYPTLTAAAQQWVQSAARAEHKTGVGRQGTAGYKRVVELTDEINREGTAGKLTAMARQVLRSMGIDPDTADPSVLAGVRNDITAVYGDPSSPGHGGAVAWKSARRTARRLVSGPLTAASAAEADDDPGDVLPVTAALTGPGAHAEQLRAWAWQDPAARLAQATARVRQLATRTTDPAALRQVQDAGRSLATLAAIRQARPDTAAARGGFDPAKHPRKSKGEHGGGQFTKTPGGGAASDEDITGGLYHLMRTGQPAAAQDAMMRAGRAYVDGDLPAAARAVREAAGHATDPGPYHDLAARIENRTAAHDAALRQQADLASRGAKAVAAALEAAIKSGHEHDTKPGEDLAPGDDTKRLFGNTADTAIVTYGDGSRWVRKRGTKLHPFTEQDINHEIGYSRVAGALGIPAPVVIKRTAPDGRPEMHEPYVNGVPAIEWTGGADPDEGDDPDPGRDPQQLYDSPEGRMIGLADMITNGTDRHLGNWMVVTDSAGDHPVPIDNNDASFGAAPISISHFTDYEPSQLAAEHPPAEWDQWQRNLAALRGEFAALGMATEWDNVMHNFGIMRNQAGAP